MRIGSDDYTGGSRSAGPAFEKTTNQNQRPTYVGCYKDMNFPTQYNADQAPDAIHTGAEVEQSCPQSNSCPVSASPGQLNTEVRDQKAEVSQTAQRELRPTETRLTVDDLVRGPTEGELREAGAKLEIVVAWRRLVQAGCAPHKTAIRLGASFSSVRRWHDALFDHTDPVQPIGEPDLESLISRKRNSGRRSPWEDLVNDPAVVKRLRELYLLTIGSSSAYMAQGSCTGSKSLALERFADESALCPAALAHQLRMGLKPEPLIRTIRAITADVEAKFRGERASGLGGTMIHHRGMFEILPDGAQVDIRMGDWWVFDDMSTNHPFWFDGPEGKVFVGRQGLYGFDIMGKWLGFDLVGTSRDAYTAAIILRFLRRLFQALGKPRRGVVFELSVWAARAIKGVRLDAKGKPVDDEYERPGLDIDDRNNIRDGLRSLGILVHYTHTPHGKEIEGAFNYYQRVFATFVTPEVINIGRHRGEFERGAKALRQAHAESHHPQSLGFLQMDAHAAIGEQTMGWINQRAFYRQQEVRGQMAEVSPEDESAPRDGSAYPTDLKALTELDLSVFLPVSRQVQLRGGKVAVKYGGNPEPLEWSAPELFASLGPGYEVLVKFDPTEPTLGAAIYNSTNADNWRGWRKGEFMGWATYLPVTPRFNWEKDGNQVDEANEMKRRYNLFVRTAFRTVVNRRVKAASYRDGQGNLGEISNIKSQISNPTPTRVDARTNTAAPTPEERVRQRNNFAVLARASREQAELSK